MATLKIKVKPDIGSSPQVVLDERNPHANGRNKITWVRDDDSPKFDFIALAPVTAPLKNPFKKIDVNKGRIKCDFEPEDANTEYKYTLTIEFNGVPYNTDEEIDPEDPSSGRAVIRN
jgi:hypothetical protein